jgi:hypothetical protein
MPISELTNSDAMLSPIGPSAGGVHAALGNEATVPMRKVVREQAGELEESCEKGAIRDTLIAARWHRWNLWLGMSSAIVAAIAAFAAGKAGIFNDIPLPYREDIPPLLALVSAVLTSILTFLAPSERACSYHTFSNKLRALRDKARCLIEIDCSQGRKDHALYDKFERLVREKSEIDASHPIVPNWVYDQAYVKMRRKLANKRSLREEKENSSASIQYPAPPGVALITSSTSNHGNHSMAGKLEAFALERSANCPAATTSTSARHSRTPRERRKPDRERAPKFEGIALHADEPHECAMGAHLSNDRATAGASNT